MVMSPSRAAANAARALGKRTGFESEGRWISSYCSSSPILQPTASAIPVTIYACYQNNATPHDSDSDSDSGGRMVYMSMSMA